jgi:hypothetical protein
VRSAVTNDYMSLFLQRALEIGIEEILLIQMSDFDLDGICKIRINDWILAIIG